MAEQDWLTPATAPTPSPYQNVIAAPSMGLPAYDLRPLSLGELLDRTFSLYRSRFWLFAGIASIAGVASLVMNVVQATAQHFWKYGTSPVASISAGAVSLVVLVIYFVAYAVTQAATVYALAEVYLGRVTTIGSSLSATVSRWYVYMGIAIWQWFSLIWLPILCIFPAALMLGIFAVKAPGLAILGGILMFVGFTGGLVGGVILFLRNILATQATVIEGLKIRPSMRRSKDLSSGAKGRIFVVLLISGAMYMVFGMLQAPLLFLVAAAARTGGEAIGAQAGMFLIGFLANTLVTPVALIGLSLVYFDQRVRKEAFDIAVLLGEPPPVAAVPATYMGMETQQSGAQTADDSAV